VRINKIWRSVTCHYEPETYKGKLLLQFFSMKDKWHATQGKAPQFAPPWPAAGPQSPKQLCNWR
jgi:hypothetical protein